MNPTPGSRSAALGIQAGMYPRSTLRRMGTPVQGRQDCQLRGLPSCRVRARLLNVPGRARRRRADREGNWRGYGAEPTEYFRLGPQAEPCLLYTSDAADDLLCVDL